VRENGVEMVVQEEGCKSDEMGTWDGGWWGKLYAENNPF